MLLPDASQVEPGEDSPQDVVDKAPRERAAALIKRSLGHVVVVVPPGFERDLAAGIAPTVEKLAAMMGKCPGALTVAGLGDTFDSTSKTASLLVAMRAKTGK